MVYSIMFGMHKNVVVHMVRKKESVDASHEFTHPMIQELITKRDEALATLQAEGMSDAYGTIS